MASISSRPLTVRVSASASDAATAGLLMCTIDSLCVSSYSSACDNAALANAAVGAPTACDVPRIGAGAGGDIAPAAAIVERPYAVSAPARARPMTSRMRSFVEATTSEGRSSNWTSDTHSEIWLANGVTELTDSTCLRWPYDIQRHRGTEALTSNHRAHVQAPIEFVPRCLCASVCRRHVKSSQSFPRSVPPQRPRENGGQDEGA